MDSSQPTTPSDADAYRGVRALVLGGSGFIGRYAARALVEKGWRVRVAVRRPNEALFVKPYGVPGQVEPLACNIRDDASVRAMIRGEMSRTIWQRSS